MNYLEKNGITNTKMYLFLMILAVATAVAFQAWRTLYNNFSIEVVGIDGFQNGVLQSLREIPGFLALLVIYILFIIKEHKLAALSVLMLGLGVSLTGFFPTYYGLIFTTILMSFGFHYFETLNQSLTLQYFDTSASPLIFGRLRSISSVSNLVVGVAVFGLASVFSYQTMFLLFGSIVCLAACYCFFLNPRDKEIPPQRKGMVLRKKYWLFYMLTFLAGARRQVFVAFAVFLIVKNFGFTIKTITILFFINNAINIFLSPMVGRAINRFGERWVLSVEYGSLIVVFLAYAKTDSAVVVGVLYVLDHIFFNFSMAIRTYFQKIADARDIAPSMAVGFTINHIAAVVIPVVGGWMWMIDYRIPFVGAAVLSAVSLGFVQMIRVGSSADS